MTLSLILEEEMRERGPIFSVSIVRGPIILLKNVTSCMGIPAQTIEKEQEIKALEKLTMLGESSPVEVIIVMLFLLFVDTVKCNPSS